MHICAYVCHYVHMHIYIYSSILIICFKIFMPSGKREREREIRCIISATRTTTQTPDAYYTRAKAQTRHRHGRRHTYTHIYTQTHKRTQTHTQTHTQTRRFGSVQKSHAIMQQRGSTYGIADSQPRRQSRVDCNRGTTVLIIAQSQPQCGTSNTDRDREVQITNVVYLY